MVEVSEAKAGDLVRLKSGGVVMTVRQNNTKVICLGHLGGPSEIEINALDVCWVDASGQPHEQRYPYELLELASAHCDHLDDDKNAYDGSLMR